MVAEANYDIRSGYLEFDPRVEPSATPRLKAHLPLQVGLETPRQATVSFVARMKEDRSATLYSHYCLRFAIAEAKPVDNPLRS